MIIGSWLTATIDIDRSTEFSGDDVDRYSSLVDLGRPYERLLIELPALSASAAISIYVQEVVAIATVPKQLNYYKPEAAGNAAWATSSGAGSLAISCEHLGGFQYIRLYASANQAADRAIRVAGARS